MYAPIVSRFQTYGFNLPGFAAAYMQTILEHDWIAAWMEAAEEEPWVIEQFDMPETGKN